MPPILTERKKKKLKRKPQTVVSYPCNQIPVKSMKTMKTYRHGTWALTVMWHSSENWELNI